MLQNQSPRALLLVLACLGQLLAGTARAETIRWIMDPNQGLQYAAQTRRPVFMYFFSMQAAPCRRMQNETFRDPIVVDTLNEEFVSIPVDATGNDALRRQYGVFRVPTILILDPEGREFTRFVTYYPADPLLDALEVLDASAVANPGENRMTTVQGAIFQESFDTLYGWGNEGSTAGTLVQLSLVRGVRGRAFAVRYQLVTDEWNWVQIFRHLSPEQQFRLPPEYTIIFQLAGEGGNNSIDFKLIDADDTNFGAVIDLPTDFKGKQYVITSDQVGYLWGGTDQRLDQVVSFQIAVRPREEEFRNGSMNPRGTVYFDEMVILPGIRRNFRMDGTSR